MPIPALIIALAALTGPAQTPPPERDQIVVRGHSWAPFISPMGEPFRAHAVTDNTLAIWFHQADRNRDGWLTVDEMQADAGRFFATLDGNGDREIEPDELIDYEWEVAPDVQVNARTRKSPAEAVAAKAREAASGKAPPTEDALNDVGRRLRNERRDDGLQGAARYALLNIPEPVAAADSNFDRDVSLSEFEAAAARRFQLLDSGSDGKIALADLEQQLASAMAAGRSHKRGKKDPDARIATPLQ